jgi:hypothetical protein
MSASASNLLLFPLMLSWAIANIWSDQSEAGPLAIAAGSCCLFLGCAHSVFETGENNVFNKAFCDQWLGA